MINTTNRTINETKIKLRIEMQPKNDCSNKFAAFIPPIMNSRGMFFVFLSFEYFYFANLNVIFYVIKTNIKIVFTDLENNLKQLKKKLKKFGGILT